LAEGMRALDGYASAASATVQDDLQFVRALLIAGAGDRGVLWRESAKSIALLPDSADTLAVILALQRDLAHAAEVSAKITYPAAREELAALEVWRRGDAAGALSRLAAVEERDPWPSWGIVPSYLIAEVDASIGDARATLAAVQRYRSLWPRGAWR